jgi:hypothetical protein
MAWEVEFITETFYTVKRYSTFTEAERASAAWLKEQHYSVDPKTWVRPARLLNAITYSIY